MTSKKKVAFVAGALVGLGMAIAGCASLTLRSQAGPRDSLLGWFKITGGDRIIPVFKVNGIYYSVASRGAEVPLKECPEGLECAVAAGTKIAFDETSNTYYIIIEDENRAHQDSGYVSGQKQPMTRIEKPSGLLDAKARRPRTNDDFLGWYQPIWSPGIRYGIRRDGEKYVGTWQVFGLLVNKPAVWCSEHVPGPNELTPLSDGLGFMMSRSGKNVTNLIYNESLKRFEITWEETQGQPAAIRMPLARIAPPPTPEGGAAPPHIEIGIPFWN